jgi:hypothetical protein
MATNILGEFELNGGVADGSVSVDVSYDIIRHVSAQLYTNPRKAIEELVCNGYDAGATECHVAIPIGDKSPLFVLDNGRSMDFGGLQALWQVARSPKVRNGGARIANNRLQIGKFGVGKLAAYALGQTLTHVACIKQQVRVVSVAQSQIKDRKGGRAPSFKVVRLPLNKARTILEERLGGLPRPWLQGTGWSTWTLAMVEDIDDDVGDALKIGILRRMIRTALPVSAQFKVFLQNEEVPRRSIDPDDIAVTVDVIDERFRGRVSEALREFWATAQDEEPDVIPAKLYEVSVQEVPTPEDISKQALALIVPGLGPIIGTAISTRTSLVTDKLEGRGYHGNGFAVTCHGKLVNPEDPLFGVTARSHKYWSRFLARVEIPGLDKVLLVQRNAVSDNSNEAQIAREVLRTLFNYTRGLVEAEEDEPGYDPGTFGSRLGAASPILAKAAITGLYGSPVGPRDLKDLGIDFTTLGVDGPVGRFDPDVNKIWINDDHPLMVAIDQLGSASRPLRRVIGEVVAGIELAKGYLVARDIPADVVDEVSDLIDAAVRSAAEFVRDAVEEHVKDIRDTSFVGDTIFEKAVVAAFRSLRLVAHHLGKSDEPDGIVEIPRSGTDNLRISIEAKGSKGVITHKELNEATVSRHGGEFGCQKAVAIAREFATDGIAGKDSALLRETKGKVPLLTVAAIEKMLRLHKQRNFTYDKVIQILTTWTHPDDVVGFVETTWRELPELGLLRLILTVAHEHVTADATNRPDPGMILGDQRIRAKKLRKDQLVSILQTVQLTTGMLTIIDPKDNTFELNAPVDTILDAMSSGGSGH